jgi:hypothetical protein
MTCPHDLAERETAVADGMCPLCLAAEIKRLRALVARRALEDDDDTGEAGISLATEGEK